MTYCRLSFKMFLYLGHPEKEKKIVICIKMNNSVVIYKYMKYGRDIILRLNIFAPPQYLPVHGGSRQNDTCMKFSNILFDLISFQ